MHKLKVPSYSQVYFLRKRFIIKELDVSRNHTETMFRHFNIPIEAEGLSITTTPEAIRYIKPADFHVPGDISSAAFFIVAALITPGSDVTPYCWNQSNTFRYY